MNILKSMLYCILVFFGGLVLADKIPDLSKFNSDEEFLRSVECQQNQLMVNSCFAKISEHYESILKDLYNKMPESEELINSQSAWLAYRSAECKWRAKPFESGSVYNTIISDCKTQLNKQRIRVFQSQISCTKDGGCSFPD